MVNKNLNTLITITKTTRVIFNQVVQKLFVSIIIILVLLKLHTYLFLNKSKFAITRTYFINKKSLQNFMFYLNKIF